MYNDWQKLTQVDTSFRAEILKGVLEENEIEAVIMNKKDSSYQIGHFEILVKSEDYLKALYILNQDKEIE
jgi:hypothetical protein